MFVALLAAAVLVPAGFTESAVINERASWVAQKPVRVYCPQTDQAWHDFLAANQDTATDVHGVTLVIGGTEAYMDGPGCTMMLDRIKGRPVVLTTLGAVLDVLAHESIHMRGESDEGKTECAAIHALPAFLVARWGFRKNSRPYRQVMAGAWSYHNRLPAMYRTTC